MTLSKKAYKGCRDFFPLEMRVRDYLFDHMKKSAESFAFEAYDGPMLEEVELYLAKSGEELINEQIYSFIDRGERKVAIRPEMTPTVARMVAQIHRETTKPIRWYSIPNLMRYEKPQKGRLREHWQFNADIFGAEAHLAEIEILSLIVHLMQSFGANETMFSIQLNDRKIVDAIFNKLLNLNQEQSYKLYKVIDKSKKVSEEALDKMIGEIITDVSAISLFKQYLGLTNFNNLKKFLEDNKLSESATDFLSFINKLEALTLNKYVHYDPTIVRGLDYYTGIVFEVFDLHPDNRRAIAGGGAYANLLQIFNENPLPGIGFGMGDVTLTDFLTTHKLMPDLKYAKNDLFIGYFDQESEVTAFNLAQDLRHKGLKVELNLGTTSFKKIFKQAESKGHQFLAMIGSNELAEGVVQIKNLTTREGVNVKLTDTQEIIKVIKG
jgi:histidyl-tRNA synthetase